MSHVEIWKGTFRKVATNEEKEDHAKSLMVEELPEYHDTYVEWLCDQEYKTYIDTPHGLFINEAKEMGDCDYVAEATKETQNTYSVDLRFYNGGTNLSETFNDAISKIEKEL